MARDHRPWTMHNFLTFALIMKVHRELAGSLPEFKQAVVTIGTFDGVHLGHRQILSQLKSEAARIGAKL
jgi:riboflavin kinase/FMN adenylyltransferase